MSTNIENVWRILYIEDDDEDFLLTRAMLAKSDGRVIKLDWAPTYEAGCAKLNHDHYDAVLVDYDLGGRSGIELIQHYSTSCPAPLILFTGRGTRDVDLEAMAAGATLYLTKKEANPLLLERAIRYAIELKQETQGLVVSNERLARELAERQQAEAALAVEIADLERLNSKSKYEGTGMGLAICREIVERHNGAIAASSVPDQGSTSTITLPIN